MSTIAPPPSSDPSPAQPPSVAKVPTPDDHLPGNRRMTARQGIIMVLAALALLVVCDGDGMRRQGEKMNRGLERDVVLAVARPAGWIADQLPFSPAVDQMV